MNSKLLIDYPDFNFDPEKIIDSIVHRFKEKVLKIP
jgi:hypothetical protein